jgi:hypothetical protein
LIARRSKNTSLELRPLFNRFSIWITTFLALFISLVSFSCGAEDRGGENSPQVLAKNVPSQVTLRMVVAGTPNSVPIADGFDVLPSFSIPNCIAKSDHGKKVAPLRLSMKAPLQERPYVFGQKLCKVTLNSLTLRLGLSDIPLTKVESGISTEKFPTSRWKSNEINVEVLAEEYLNLRETLELKEQSVFGFLLKVPESFEQAAKHKNPLKSSKFEKLFSDIEGDSSVLVPSEAVVLTESVEGTDQAGVRLRLDCSAPRNGEFCGSSNVADFEILALPSASISTADRESLAAGFVTYRAKRMKPTKLDLFSNGVSLVTLVKATKGDTVQIIVRIADRYAYYVGKLE